MKKLTCAIALSTLLLAGCSQEDGIMESKGELVTLNYNISLTDGVQSRAGNEQVIVNKLYCAIYEVGQDEAENTTYNYVRTDKVDANFNNTVTYTPALFKNLEYKIIFWAQYEETEKDPYYNLSNNTLLAITVNNNVDTNVYNSFPKKDAFTAISSKAKGYITAPNEGSVTLTRPFSQVNVYTLDDDWTQAVALNRTPTSSTIKIQQCQTTYNAMTQSWDGNATELVVTSIPSYGQKFTYTNGTSDTSDDWNCCTLFSEYVFASCGANVNCELKIFDNTNETICEENIPNFPLLKNKRTNVIGRIMTGLVEYNVSTGNWGDDKNIAPNGTEM